MNQVYTVYKTTNKINNRFYIGVHKTSNPFDDYMGSGKVLKRAVEKYGLENFEKEILAIFETADEAYQLESNLVTIDLIETGQCYNLKEGGQGGWNYANKGNYNLYGKNGTSGYGLENLKYGEERTEAMKTNGTYDEWKIKISGTLLEQYKSGERISYTLGLKHSEEAKQKIGQANSIHQTGSGNSQFGTCWIKKDGINKKVKKEELETWLEQGWSKGRYYNMGV